MAIAHVQTITEVSVSSGTVGTTGSFSSTAGNILITLICDTAAENRDFTVTDSTAGTWTNDANLNGTNGREAQVSSYKNITGSGTQTVTVTASTSATYRFRVVEFSGCDTTTQPEDTSTNDEASTTTAPNMGASTKLDTAGEAVLCGCGTANSNPSTLTAGSGFTKITSAATTIMYQYGIFASPQTDNRCAFTCATARTWSCACAAYKVAAAAAVSDPPQRRMNSQLQRLLRM